MRNSKAHEKLWDEMRAKQRAEHDKWLYSPSRFYSFVKDNIEHWVYFEEYESEERYQKWQRIREEMNKNEEFKLFMERWIASCIKDSMVTTSWTEYEALRTDKKNK